VKEAMAMTSYADTRREIDGQLVAGGATYQQRLRIQDAAVHESSQIRATAAGRA
jgi:hypothetical protein